VAGQIEPAGELQQVLGRIGPGVGLLDARVDHPAPPTEPATERCATDCERRVRETPHQYGQQAPRLVTMINYREGVGHVTAAYAVAGVPPDSRPPVPRLAVKSGCRSGFSQTEGA